MAVGWLIWRSMDRPSRANPVWLHRLGWPPGGSATSNRPPWRRKGAAHSAVTAGGPKLRDTTTSRADRSSPRPASSARLATTRTRSPRPSCSTASCRKAARDVPPSSSIQLVSGRARARGSPGSPPPLPRSRPCADGSSRSAAKCRARWMWGSIGPGPRKPRRWASARTA
jgi:hypothetical protein